MGTYEVFSDFIDEGVRTAIDTARDEKGMAPLAAWQDDLPIVPLRFEEWEQWLPLVPTPFGIVLLGENTTSQLIGSGRMRRSMTLYVAVSVEAANANERSQKFAKTEDSTVSGVIAALPDYFTADPRYPRAEYQGCQYLPFETRRADKEIGLCVTQWAIEIMEDV